MPPAIDSFDPDSGKSGDPVTLYVSRIPAGTAIDDVDVTLGQAECQITDLSTGLDRIGILVPQDAPPSAVFTLTLATATGFANSAQTFACYSSNRPRLASVFSPSARNRWFSNC